MALSACPKPLVTEGPDLAELQRAAGPTRQTAGASPDDRPLCAPLTPGDDPVVVDVVLLTAGPELAKESWRAFAEAAAFWAPLGVKLCPAERTLSIPAGPLVLARSRAPLEALLRALPAREPTLYFGAVERIVAPDAEVLRIVGALDGLGLPGRPNAVSALLDAPHPPIALLSAHSARQALAAQDVAAHELGHALGLEHDGDEANLMHPARRRGCRPVLTPAQLEAVRAELAERRGATRTSRSSRRACPSGGTSHPRGRR